mmetsp:Transcript_16071/g.45462  ORF Transcript_16071/g.45462 Transcript_16071/m.45462 type:complete len:224 (+) Transcript_16071:292-963(+)
MPCLDHPTAMVGAARRARAPQPTDCFTAPGRNLVYLVHTTYLPKHPARSCAMAMGDKGKHRKGAASRGRARLPISAPLQPHCLGRHGGRPRAQRLYDGQLGRQISHALSMATTTSVGSGPCSAARRFSSRCATVLAPRMTASCCPPASWLWCIIQRMAAAVTVMPACSHVALTRSSARKYSGFQKRSRYLMPHSCSPKRPPLGTSAMDWCLPVRKPPASGLYA